MSQPGQRQTWVHHQGTQVSDAAVQLPQLIEAKRPRLSPQLANAVLTPEARDVLATIEEHARTRIAAVEAQAANDIAAAQAEMERWRAHALASEAEARERGFTAGFAEGQPVGFQAGEAAAWEAQTAQLARLTALADSCTTDMRQAILVAQADLADLSLEVARAIIGETLRADPELVTRRVAHLAQRLSERVQATVRVNPDDLPLVQAHWPALARSRRASDQGPQVIADDAIAVGGCAIETRTQFLEGQWDLLLELVREAFATITAEQQHAPLLAQEAA